ncbi:MAG: SMI1/KNR4 family protein [Polyangiaceae bacterium]|nr:SMI1/KNR4 family protein [Polyangiaceae bacterium]
MDSDLAESVSALKAIFQRRKLSLELGAADATLVEDLRKKLRIPSRFRSFLLEANPVRLETVSPVERVRLLPAAELLEEQKGFALQEDGSPRVDNGGTWRKSWIIVGRSTLLGDPYFLDVAKLDAEGDCPVYTAMSGTERWEPNLCASTFAQFLRILAISMEVAQGFGEAILDDEDEASFRESLGHKIKSIDPAALRAGHWTLGPPWRRSGRSS